MTKTVILSQEDQNAAAEFVRQAIRRAKEAAGQPVLLPSVVIEVAREAYAQFRASQAAKPLPDFSDMPEL